MSSSRTIRPFGYQALMPHLVEDILMVASPYDSFIMEEDGRFSDRMLSEYVEMDLAAPPHFRHVSTARAALKALEREPSSLVLATPHFGGKGPTQLAAEVSRSYPDSAVVMLTYDRADAEAYCQRPRSEGIAQTFLWTGDPKLLVALVKSVEDMKNLDHDTSNGMVRVIILVEDSPSFYSSYLPIIYSEVMGQVHSLLADRLNERDRRHRMRARPKILLARNYEEGVELFDRYRKFALGIVCDMRFPRRGKLDPGAGRRFIRRVRRKLPDIPVLLQSREAAHAALAEELGVHFADKNSPELLNELRMFMRNNLGFGSFVFQRASGKVVVEATDMAEMIEALETVPAESLRYHGERNHISNWLMARSEFALALEVRPRQVSDFEDTEALRVYLLDVFSTFLDRRQRGEITDFSRRTSPVTRDFMRIGSGSMGGKARGVAFLSQVLAEDRALHERYPEVRILVPRAAVVCTDVFDRYCATESLREKALEAASDEEVLKLFLDHPLPEDLMEDLDVFVSQIRYPLAVRSSSLHEDSESYPLAGLYHTFMLPNCGADQAVRAAELSRAIRLVYASVFSRSVRAYMESSSLRVEEEKMAVLIQRVAGRRHGSRFYPDFSGVAQSVNYYPLQSLAPEDGLVTVALGLGQTVSEGRRGLTFSPRHPEILPQLASPKAALDTSQRQFYALRLVDSPLAADSSEAANLELFDLEAAEEDGTLDAVGATYSAENDRVYDTVHREGVRLVSFAGVLKHGRFPLSPLLGDLLEIGEEGMGTAVEMEFAVTLGADGEPAEMAVVQLRPMAAQSREADVDLEDLGDDETPLVAGRALGNGVVGGLKDVVYVHPERIEMARSRDVAEALGRLDHRLRRRRRPYLLIGPGRWGTADPWLGIPVAWSQVSGAKVIVEAALPGASIDPSQGSHFFHNLTSLAVGYFDVDAADPEHVLDLEWLESLPAKHEELAIRHVELPAPAEARIDGRAGRGLVLRPSARPEGG